MKVKDLMTREVATVAPDSPLAQAATLMRQEDCGPITRIPSSRRRDLGEAWPSRMTGSDRRRHRGGPRHRRARHRGRQHARG